VYEKLNRREALKSIGALVVTTTAGGVGGYFVGKLRDERQLQELRTELKLVKEQQAVNLLGDCANENMLRGLYGKPPVTVRQCIEERAKLLDRRNVPKGIPGKDT
jgi:hypothetical protein